jgi:hypothetical protein
MMRNIKILAVIGMCLALVWLPACSSPPATSTPTLDMAPFQTEVAATVWAQVTQDLALTPSVTSPPSPTPTSEPTITTAAQISTPQISASPVLTGTLTIGTSEVGSNRAEWVSQTILDGTVFAPGETFTMTWRLRNAGITTWTAAYMLRYYSGETFGAPKEILLGREVLPNEIADISIPMSAPAIPGNYRSDWVMATASRSNFNQPIFLKITVAIPSTPTSPPIPTPTTAP